MLYYTINLIIYMIWYVYSLSHNDIDDNAVAAMAATLTLNYSLEVTIYFYYL
jgi:hypothetical protein